MYAEKSGMTEAVKRLNAAFWRMEHEIEKNFLEPEARRKANQKKHAKDIKALQKSFDEAMDNAQPRLEDDERSRAWNRMVLDYLMFKAEAEFAKALEKGLRKVGKKQWNKFRGPIIKTIQKLANDAASPEGWLAKRLENPSVADRDTMRAFLAEAFGLEPDAIPMGWTSMFDELAKAMEEMTKGIRGYLPAGPEVAGLLTGPTEVEMEAEEESPSTAMDAAEALARAGERFRNRRAAEAIAQDTALPETGAEGEGDFAGLAGNTALSVTIREQYDPNGWGDLGRKVNVVGDGKPFYKRPAPKGKRKTQIKDIKEEVMRLAFENVSEQPNVVMKKLDGDKNDRFFLAIDGVLHQIAKGRLFHSANSADEATIDAVTRIGDLFNASVEVPGDFGDMHYRVAAMRLDDSYFVLFTERDLGGEMEVRDVQILKSVSAKKAGAPSQVVTPRELPANTISVANLKEAWEGIFLGGMERHLEQKAKPKPGLITIPPANTALSVGDLHTGARMAYGKPDSKFIGSGEGAQVFGWGHYSSNRKGVARDEYAMRYVKDFQKRSKVQHKGDPKSAVSIGGVVYDNVVDFAYEASRIEEALHNKLQNYERIEKDEEGNFVVGDKTVPKELLTFIAATRAALVDAQTVFSAWTGKAVSKDYRDPEFYRIARYRAKSEQDSVLPMSRFYGEMMLRGPLKSKKAWAAFVDTFFPKVERVIPEGPRPSVINQTWWTHRPKGDESHLLNWYEPLSEENWSRVLKTLEDLADEHGAKPYEMDAVFGRGWRDREVNGESAYIMVADFFRHMTESDYPEKDASEALYAHDIDGVKYPVDTFSNDDNMDGRLGWNYVAFSDEHLRVDSVEEWNPETDRFEPRPVPGNTAMSVVEPKRGDTIVRRTTFDVEEDNERDVGYYYYVNDMPVAYASVRIFKDSTYVERIDVEDDYQNMGFGTRILKQLADEYGDVYVAPDNEDAKRLYERIGYDKVGSRAYNESYYAVDEGYGVYSISGDSDTNIVIEGEDDGAGNVALSVGEDGTKGVDPGRVKSGLSDFAKEWKSRGGLEYGDERELNAILDGANRFMDAYFGGAIALSNGGVLRFYPDRRAIERLGLERAWMEYAIHAVTHQKGEGERVRVYSRTKAKTLDDIREIVAADKCVIDKGDLVFIGNNGMSVVAEIVNEDAMRFDEERYITTKFTGSRLRRMAAVPLNTLMAPREGTVKSAGMSPSFTSTVANPGGNVKPGNTAMSVGDRAQAEEIRRAFTRPDGTKRYGWRKAPNGQASSLDEKQWLEAQTPRFKAQYGDWEAAALYNMAKRAWNDPKVNEKFFFKPSERLAKAIEAEVGHPIEQLVVKSDRVRHIKNHHSNRRVEAARGQRALSPLDVATIPYLVNNFDTIERHPKHDQKGRIAFRITKRINGISSIGLLEWGNAGAVTVTMWEVAPGGQMSVADGSSLSRNVQDEPGADVNTVQQALAKIKQDALKLQGESCTI